MIFLNTVKIIDGITPHIRIFDFLFHNFSFLKKVYFHFHVYFLTNNTFKIKYLFFIKSILLKDIKFCDYPVENELL